AQIMRNGEVSPAPAAPAPAPVTP
ncbi:hypothetical protein, partial [Klebsiella pneumoniae]